MTTQALEARLRAARRVVVRIGAWTFHARRPTDVEAGEMAAAAGGRVTAAALALRFVDGWEGVRVRDIAPDAADADVGQQIAEWSPGLFREWVADRPDIYGRIGGDIMAAYSAHADAAEAAIKNSGPGVSSTS